ncbi:MAG: GAF domain-containing protein [Anaerolineaceae bacterium]|nr:MAG: GAF domain-containing protein [Anaerolineaceae bacterium]
MRRVLPLSLAVIWALILFDLTTVGTLQGNLLPVSIILHITAFIGLYALRDPRNVRFVAYGGHIALVIVIALQIEPINLYLISATTLVVGAYLLDRYAYLALVIAVAAIIGWNVWEAFDRGEARGVAVAASGIVAITISTMAARHFNGVVRDFARRNERNNNLIRAAGEVGQVTNSILSLDELFGRAVEVIRDRFAYYHVQIFLVDEEGQYADLVSSTGEAGRRLLETKHRLPVGSQSVIGRVTQIGEPIIAADTDRDDVHARNELLPDTRSEMALPITDSRRIIGALDVQSTRSNAFSQVDIQALQIVATQLGVAIRNARLFEAQEESVRENKRLFFESEASLREIQRLNRQLTQKSWRDFIESGDVPEGVSVADDKTASPIVDTNWSSVMIDASKRRRIIVDDAANLMAVPIVLRNEVIGAIEVEIPTAETEEDHHEILRSVATRLAVSLDNARLFEEAQQSTIREQQLNEIVGRYQAANTVDELLQITLSELKELFGADGGKIRLGRPASQTAGAESANGAPPMNGHSQNGDHHD